MKTQRHIVSSRGFTMTELLVVLAIIVVIAGLLLPAFMKPSGSKYIRCVSNLKQIGLGFRLYANDNEGAVPYPGYNLTNSTWNYFQIVGKEIGSPKVLLCPVDPARNRDALDFETNGSIRNFSYEKLQDNAVSYFYGVDAEEGQPNTILAGDRNVSTNATILAGLLSVETNTTVKWTRDLHNDAGNIAMADGSAQQLSSQKLREVVANGFNTNGLQRFVIPR